MPGTPAPIMSFYPPKDSEVSISVPVLRMRRLQLRRSRDWDHPAWQRGRKDLIAGGSSLPLLLAKVWAPERLPGLDWVE